MIGFRQLSEREKAHFRVSVRGERPDSEAKIMDPESWCLEDFDHGHPDASDITDDYLEDTKETDQPETGGEPGGYADNDENEE